MPLLCTAGADTGRSATGGGARRPGPAGRRGAGERHLAAAALRPGRTHPAAGAAAQTHPRRRRQTAAGGEAVVTNNSWR